MIRFVLLLYGLCMHDDAIEKGTEENSDDEEERSSERVPLQGMVTYRLDGQEYGNLAADVSPDGMFIRTFMPPPVGTRLDLTLDLPKELGGFRLDLEGRVARVVKDEDPRQNGMGVQFLAVHATAIESVHKIVSLIFRVGD